MFPAFLTKMKGKIPTMKVIMKLMANGPSAESFPFTIETIRDRNMNSALTSRACPTFFDMTLMSILRIFYSSRAADEVSMNFSLSSRSLAKRLLSSEFSSASSVTALFRLTNSSSPSNS